MPLNLLLKFQKWLSRDTAIGVIDSNNASMMLLLQKSKLDKENMVEKRLKL